MRNGKLHIGHAVRVLLSSLTMALPGPLAPALHSSPTVALPGPQALAHPSSLTVALPGPLALALSDTELLLLLELDLDEPEERARLAKDWEVTGMRKLGSGPWRWTGP